MAGVVTAYLEQQLPFGKRMWIKMHLAMCRHCRKYFQQVERVAAAAGDVGKVELPDEVAVKLDALFKRLDLGGDD